MRLIFYYILLFLARVYVIQYSTIITTSPSFDIIFYLCETDRHGLSPGLDVLGRALGQKLKTHIVVYDLKERLGNFGADPPF